MSLVVEENYASGIPQTILPGFLARGIAWHWTAGGTGRVGWGGTVTHLIATRLSTNASYHGGFWPEHIAGHVGCRTIVQWIVRTTRAAHSIAPSQVFQYNPNKAVDLQSERFVEVRRILGSQSSDPNAACIALAYAGMPEDLEADLACPVFRADVKELAARVAERPGMSERPHFGHGWIQPITRYEMDVQTDFIGMLYGEDTLRLLPSHQTLMTGRLREATGIAKLPLFDAELLASLDAGTWLGIVHRMPGQGSYVIDGVTGRDWLAVAIGDEVGYVEEPYIVDRHVSDAGRIVVPAPAPADCSAQEVALNEANEALGASLVKLAAARVAAQATVDALAA